MPELLLLSRVSMCEVTANDTKKSYLAAHYNVKKLYVLVIYCMIGCLPCINAFKQMQLRNFISSIRISQKQPQLLWKYKSLKMSTASDINSLTDSIKSKGEEVRILKSTGGSKDLIDKSVAELLALKNKYAEVAGKPFDPPKATSSKSASKPASKPAPKQVESTSNVESKITLRSEDYSAWYNDVISASDMVDQSPVRGCMVIKPWGMGVWDLLRAELDQRIRDSGTVNAYFPLFIPKSFLAKEAEHVDGFAKECAVVTHHRLCMSADGKDLIPDPDAKLDEPLIVRPTSETVIWNMFSKWINSHRDLPLKINQWANVVRWEMRTRPFLRTTEFLWQEGHTAHATADDAIKTSLEMLDMYAEVCKVIFMYFFEGSLYFD